VEPIDARVWQRAPAARRAKARLFPLALIKSILLLYGAILRCSNAARAWLESGNITQFLMFAENFSLKSHFSAPDFSRVGEGGMWVVWPTR